MQDRNTFREGVDDQSQPEHVLGVAQPCAQFFQLQVRKVEMAEGALVQDLCVFASASQLGGDMVSCRYPKTRSAAEASSPQARAESTRAIWWEGVFSRYSGVCRRAVNVV